MTKSFKCPYCSAPIRLLEGDDRVSIKCNFCGLIAPVAVDAQQVEAPRAVEPVAVDAPVQVEAPRAVERVRPPAPPRRWTAPQVSPVVEAAPEVVVATDVLENSHEDAPSTWNTVVMVACIALVILAVVLAIVLVYSSR